MPAHVPAAAALVSGARPSGWCLTGHPGMRHLRGPQPALRLASLEADRGVRREIFPFQNVVHELRITNQVIYLNPPIEECRYKLYQEMFAWKMIVLSLPRIQSQRYQVSLLARPPRLCHHLAPVSLNTALGVFSAPNLRPSSPRGEACVPDSSRSSYFSQELFTAQVSVALRKSLYDLGEFYFLLLSSTPTFYYGSLQTSTKVERIYITLFYQHVANFVSCAFPCTQPTGYFKTTPKCNTIF